MLKVNAIYEGFQGEGVHTGQRTTFIRLTDCNFRCKFCDTKYAWKDGVDMTEYDIVEQITTPHVCLTGGEPLYQNIQPLTELLEKEYYVTIETNGSIVSYKVYADFWSISPKLTNSGARDQWDIETLSRLFGYVAQYDVQLKFVIQKPEDMFEAMDIVKGIEESGYWASVACPIIFQPDGLNLPKLEETDELYAQKMKPYFQLMRLMTITIQKNDKVFQKYDVRIMPQLHRLMWPELKDI